MAQLGKPAGARQAVVDNLLSLMARDPRPVALGLAAMLVVGCADMRSGPSADGRPDADWSLAREVTVIMTEYHFTPNELNFERGVPYRLHLENRGTELHEFTAPGFLAAVELRDRAVLGAGRNEVVVAPRTDKAIDFVAPQAGRYEFGCADHDWAGMVGTIAVR